MTMRNVKKRLIVLLMLTVAITVLPVTTASGASTAMHGSTYSITTSVISGGGGVMTSDSYQMQATIGQPSPLMEQTSPPYSAFHDLYPGFWYTLDVGPACATMAIFTASFGSMEGDINYCVLCDFDRDGDVDGSDLYNFTLDIPGTYSDESLL